LDKIYNKIFKDIPTYSRFLKVDEIDKLVNLTASFSNVKKEVIGKTLENENLISIEIGEADKTALIIGVPHSDEPLGSLVITFFSRWLALNEKTNFFNWRWIFIPILERRGMRLNEGWFNMPDSFAALAKSNFREPTEDQYEWSFPIKYEDYEWTKSRPETIAIKNLIKKEKPDLLCNLHHCGFHNAYYYLSDDLPKVYPELIRLAKSVRIPLSDSAPDVPFGEMFYPGFYKMYGLKEYIDYFTKKDPDSLLTLKRGACSDEWYKKKLGGFSFNCEVPMYLSSKLQDKKISNKNYKYVLNRQYLKKINRLNYSLSIFDILKKYENIADPLLFDVVEKHMINAQDSLAHEKRISDKIKNKKISKSEVFEIEVISDLFDLFFLGQIWRVAESICVKGGTPQICQLMEKIDIEIKSLSKSIYKRGMFYQIPIRNSVKLQLGSLLIIANAINNYNS